MSEPQNVQRGLVFLFFMQFVVLLIAAIYRMVKNKLDIIDETESEGERGANYKEGEGRESVDHIDGNPDFNKVVVRNQK